MYPYLKGKNILLGVTSGIAIYKAVDLISKMRQIGSNPKVIMTKNAQKWVSDQIFSAVGNCEVYYETFDVKGGWIPHTELSRWAELLIVAPATANIIAKISHGIADDLLSCTALAYSKTSKIIVPTMNVRMYENPVNKRNLEILKQNSWTVVEPEEGHLADGEIGKGRYPYNSEILEYSEYLLSKKDFMNKRVLVTAGPTVERIDPVRFLSNRSSGRMGYELAREFANRGADVTLISGPTNLEPPTTINKIVRIESAEELRQKVLEHFEDSDIIIMTAAVSDLRIKNYSDQKLKKDKIISLEIEKNPDIIKELGRRKRDGQILVGFAAETENLKENAMKKLKEKNMDMIILNDVSRKDIGFEKEENEVTIFTSKEEHRLEKNHKRIIAGNICDFIFSNFF
ncbi:bifunctional phosphopantothenoylcysteine decarboxylase/phosphopantothenate--cysteine ligase CoaBC [Petrotoga olearia]|uniref:Coenzyme A biosynthesis bifunctional protein CoaBC n=2 Tax=Petrotoga olearia TaxID=156203 RepID=A0A2K1P127_9BACT|nr:bifunctional phosphopantothenoylcysteine decarboxylase/phosphopantothenate--cysteine ligase CoaBC [Petrotoga olearia]PNR96493.1 DNA/pantothenate metabolism flavoprotein [Petrotoga olearia DSM 13574]RMA76420.1 phosphopantothenate-cysteine ligase /phosphopantothenoylcysteine decarboxylase [Petrotoga olearia]